MFNILLISLGVAMDAFGVSIALGVKSRNFYKGIVSSVMFGGFQAVMPLIGWIIGEVFKSYISGVDHWIAFLLLIIIGIRMIYGDLNNKQSVKQKNIDFRLLITLAFATSIDALVVGMGIAFLDIPILLAVSIIGLVTFIISLAGIYIGTKSSKVIDNKAGIFGGLVLILIGIKILTDHLFF